MENMIKNLLRTAFAIALSVVAMTACSDDDDATVAFGVDKTSIALEAAGGTETLLVEASQPWVAEVSEPWLMVSPANGCGTAECTVVVDSTLLSGIRTATLRISPQVGAPVEVEVMQSGFGNVIVVEKSEAVIESSAQREKRYYEATVTANIPFAVHIGYADGESDWLTPGDIELNLDRGARPRTVKVRFDWKMNTAPQERVAQISFVPANEEDEVEEPALLTLTQKPAVRIEDNRQGDSIALLTIYERINCMSDAWDTSENMRNWRDVTLWEASDKDLPAPEAVGRVRSVYYSMFNTDEPIPQEVKYLRFLETFEISSNVNTMFKTIELGDEICSLKHLKSLTVFSYGIVTLPEEFKNLGATLEYLNLSANNLSDIPSVLTKENFPKLKTLIIVANRRWSTVDIRRESEFEDGLGLHINTERNNSLRRLLLWDTLEEIGLSNNYIEGSVPDFTPGEEGVEAYTQADVDAFGGDTIQYLADNKIPKILPNIKSLRINLNFFTGKLPDWLLYHPRLLDWFPEVLVFHQQEHGLNSKGEITRFENEPTSFEYYYDALPGMREKYEFKETITE